MVLAGNNDNYVAVAVGALVRRLEIRCSWASSASVLQAVSACLPPPTLLQPPDGKNVLVSAEVSSCGCDEA